MLWVGELGAKGKQIALNLLEHDGKPFRGTGCPREAEPGLQLVDVAVRVDARVGLRHAGAVEQRRFAQIAGPGIDLQRHDFMILPIPAARQRFRRTLLAWYRRHGRALPWRETSDPYHVLVSEVILHQTQVDRVVP